MAAHTLLLEFLLLISACLQFSQISAQRTRDDLPYHVQPTGYVLKLLPLPQDELFIGNIKISILCVSKTSTIVLHADKDLFIPRGGIVVREPRDASNNIHIQIPVANITRNTQMNQLTIALNQELEEWATYEVKLHFSGKLTTADDWGFFRSRYIDRVTGEEKWYVGTKLKPGMARKVFPCFDGTEYKATFSISVGRHNATNATVLSSMKRKSITHMKTADGWVWENFHHTPRMLPSSIGIAMFELEEVVSGSAPTVDIRIYGNKVLSSQLETLLKDFMKLMVFMEHYLDRTLPLRKIDLVVLPDFVLDAHVNSWGLILMSDYLLPNDWTALHGLLDLWFRHFSTPENEDSPLCNALHKFFFWQSGLVPWMPADHLDGLLGDDSSPKMNSEHYESFLRMLNYSVSSETVRLGLQSFVGDRQAFATYSDTVLWYFLTASGHHQNTLDMSMAVKDIAYSWVGLDYATVDDVEVDDSNVFSWTKIDQEHILIEGTTRMDRMPIVTVSRNYQNNTATVEQHVFVKQRLNKKHISSFWWIPIMYLTPNSLDPSLIQPKTWMRGENEVTITRLPSENDFIIVNPEYAGMFVVNYDKHNWRLLVDYLQSNQFQKIPELTRSKLLYDSWNLAYFGELDMVTALNMSQYLSQETSEAVWRPFLVLFNEFLEYMSDTAAETLLEGYMLNQLLGARTSGADWITDNMLCRYGYEDCIYYLKGAYNMWTAHNNLEYKLTYDQFCYTFKYGTMEEYEFGLDFLLTHEIKDKWNYSNMFFLLQTLALCPVDSEKVERYLNAIFVAKNSNILDVDIMSILIRFRNHAQGRWMTVLDFVSKNFAAVKNRLKKVPHVWNLLVSEVTRHFITQEGLNEIGIIGGTGLDDPDILENRKETTVTTPFGDPSDVLIEGQISGVDCFVGKELKTA